MKAGMWCSCYNVGVVPHSLCSGGDVAQLAKLVTELEEKMARCKACSQGFTVKRRTPNAVSCHEVDIKTQVILGTFF
eukprot:3182241-Amphidinium_carterae.2